MDFIVKFFYKYHLLKYFKNNWKIFIIEYLNVGSNLSSLI